MPELSRETIERLVSTYGETIDLRANPGVLEDILREVRREVDFGNSPVAGYDKTYYRGYDKDNYDKEYNQYDRTVDIVAIEDLVNERRLELLKRFSPDNYAFVQDILGELKKRP
ncbi:MAG TPA: hypothetical protein VM450_20405 [Thermomicrobiales bacterium]|nr:hypothetical protein [Thermomicrobiales bacterium]